MHIDIFTLKFIGMINFPCAKINIGLRITSRREDGYHNIQTIFYPVRLCDVLEFVIMPPGSDDDRLTITGMDAGNPCENLVLKVLATLRKIYKIPYLDIHLHKVIPPGAGLGGGSSDAAFFLKMINRHFGLGLNNEDLRNLALSAGSDAPFFIENLPAYAEGRGECLTSLPPLPEGYHLVILYPGISISTREAYMKCTPVMREPLLPVYYREDIIRWRKLIINDFEKIVFESYPVLGELKEKLYENGALYSSMSGSGSAVYGIFSEKPELPPALSRHVIYSGPF